MNRIPLMLTGCSMEIITPGVYVAGQKIINEEILSEFIDPMWIDEIEQEDRDRRLWK